MLSAKGNRAIEETAMFLSAGRVVIKVAPSYESRSSRKKIMLVVERKGARERGHNSIAVRGHRAGEKSPLDRSLHSGVFP